MRWRCDIGFLWCWPLGWSVHCARHSHHCYHKIKQGELNNGSSTLVFYISVNVNLERNFPSGGPGCFYQSGLYAGEQKCHLRFLSDLCTVQHHRSATLWEQILLNKIYCLYSTMPLYKQYVFPLHKCTADKERFEDGCACKDRVTAAQKCIFPWSGKFAWIAVRELQHRHQSKTLK